MSHRSIAGDETQQIPRLLSAPGSQVCTLDTALFRGALPQSADTLRPQAGKHPTETGAL